MARGARNDEGTDVFLILLAIFLPPLAVAIKSHNGVDIGINLLLTILGWIPGVLHAWYIITRRHREGVAIVTERPPRRSSSRNRHGGSSHYSSHYSSHDHGRRRSRSSHRQPMTYVQPGGTKYKRTSSSSRRYYA